MTSRFLLPSPCPLPEGEGTEEEVIFRSPQSGRRNGTEAVPRGSIGITIQKVRLESLTYGWVALEANSGNNARHGKNRVS